MHYDSLIIFLLGMLISVLILRWWVSKEQTYKLLTMVLGDPEFLWDEGKKSFQWNRMNYRYEKLDGSRNRPPSFSVFLDCAAVTGGEFEIVRESVWDRLFKKVGMTHEVQTGDESFDRRYYIASDSPHLADECFASFVRREAVRRIFNMRAKKILYKGDVLSVKWTGVSSHDKGISNLRETVEALAVIARDLPIDHEQIVLSKGYRNASSRRNWVIALAVVSAALGLASFLVTHAYFPPLDPWAFFVSTLKFSLPALGLFLSLAVWMLVGNSRSHRVFLLAGAIALGGFLFLGYGVAGIYNGMSDTTPPTRHLCLILRKEVRKSRNTAYYSLHAQPWVAGRHTEDIETDPATYQKVVPGRDRVQIDSRPGKLGYEWKVSQKVL